MENDFDKNVKSEDIVLSDLKNLEYKSFHSCFDTWRMEYNKEKEYPNKSPEEIKAEIQEEIKKSTEKSAKEAKEKYYQFNSEKNKELEQKFKQINLKLNFNCVPKILRDGKFYTISQGCFTVYDDRFFNKQYEIIFEEVYNITSAIQLDNKDLVFFASNLIIIYRLKEEKYFLYQKIEENQTGYHQQMSYSGCMSYPKTFEASFIKEISGNRFICVSNYGFKMYSLNEKNEYSITLLEWYHEGLKTIIELDKNSFIFCTEIYCGASLGGPAHNVLIIDKMDLREITEEERKNKLIEEADAYRYYEYKGLRERYKITDEKAKKVIESLKFTYDHIKFIKYSSYGGYHYFEGNAILKNKYFIVGIDNNILIYDIPSGKQIKRYKLLINGEDNLYIYNANIIKWNNNEDNEFLINIKGNIALFELTNDNDLKIINQCYFENINCLKKLNEKKNGFYNDDIEENDSYYGKKYYSYSNACDDNKNCCVSIFY